ncbi:TATA box-binding protein-associated factor, RNA polymerase I, subunit C-like [Hippocampus zosterae]|uniref:TATA box-binding protein-associated factor, RNA polymerase I, subunit C-like n=1 Tax=Hippocampus zosterae TaxID=109293 RepID=UPI00223DCD54|nr:TATA box-binding protein-associated factor, RNA polymerase I, subunit C-like [Hippocampus zosterae]
MDYHFPPQLFPSFYNSGPPGGSQKPCAEIWGSYDLVQPQGGSGPPSNWTFTSRHQVKGEIWRHREPAPIPLLKPNNSLIWSSTLPNPLDFTEHMQNFYIDHCQDAFGCISEVLGDNFYFKHGRKQRQHKDAVHTWKIKRFLDLLNFPLCHRSDCSTSLQAYSALLSDVVQNVPPELLGSLLYEELTEQRDRQLFYEGATGGALDFIPFCQIGDSQHGCLLYPGNRGMDRLNFHRVAWELQPDKCFSLNSSKSKPFGFQLKGPIRQISSASLFNICCVAVRSDRLCGLWRFGDREEPRLLQVVNTKEVATCVTVSPHVLGEVLVASESGIVNLWTVGKGIQKVWEDDSNLYFNAKSSWRWCEFSAHPRVMLYADRTGAELCDIRTSPASNRTLFSISSTAACRAGERLLLSKYLAEVHAFHHLVTTQYSAYILDERFPRLPVLKMDHMMHSPPMFCHVLPGVSSSGSRARSAKVFLASQSSQEVTQLQYSGGRTEACVSVGPPQSLLRPRDSLQHLPVQIPHRQDTAANRLSSSSAGLTCIQRSARDGSYDCVCVLQLTQAGDIFYQILEHERPDGSSPPATEDEAPPETNPRKPPPATLESTPETARESSAPRLAPSQLTVPDTSGDEDVIPPTQILHRFVAETPERKLRGDFGNSDTGSEDSETRRRGRNLKGFNLQLFVNDDQAPERRLSADGENGNAPSGVQDAHAHRPLQLGEDALNTWKVWLQKLMRKSRKKKPRPRPPHQVTVNAGGLFGLTGDKIKKVSQESQSMRRQLSLCMSERSPLVRSSASSDVVPFPQQVDAEAWPDDLSRRLTLAWRGEDKWRAWWQDRLGLNKEFKRNALRRRRRKEREARMRSAGRRLALSESFTSSITYQSELDDFSDFRGWSSGAASETERLETEGATESEAPRAKTPAAVLAEADSPAPIVLTPMKTVQLDSAPSGQRRSKRPAEDFLASLFGSQDDPAQHDYDFDAEGPLWGPVRHPSQSLPLSQSSLGRPCSQSSQPKKKKARMGF